MTTMDLPLPADDATPTAAPLVEPVPYADPFLVPLTTRPMLPMAPEEPAHYRWAWLAIGLAVTALFAVVAFRFYAPADAGVDQNAYLVGGRLIAQHGTPKYVLPNPYAYTGGMFVRMPTGVYYPKYPFGLPLLYACFFWLFGPVHGPVWAFIVSPASATLAVLGTFFLARAVAGSFAAVMAAVLLGSSQVMLQLADNPNSHAAAVAVIVWGMFLLVRWWQTGRVWQGIGAGLLIGYAFTIRYTEGLLVLPVALACLTRIRWRHWGPWVMSSAIAAAGGAFLLTIGLWTASDWDAAQGIHHWFGPGRTSHSLAALALAGYAAAAIVAVAIAAKNGHLPRAWWTSFLRNVMPGLAWCVPVVVLVIFNSATMRHAAGYDTTHESELGVAFQLKYLVRNWELVVRTFDDLELFFVVPFAIAGLALVFRRSWRFGLLLLAWVVPGVLLYTSYYWSMDFDVAYARFYLTFLPALCVAAAVAFHDGLLGGRVGGTGVANGWSRVPATVAVGLVVAIASGVSTYRAIHGLRDGTENLIPLAENYRGRLNLARVGQELLDHVPARSVLFSSAGGGIQSPTNYVQFLRDWDVYASDAFSEDGARRGFGGGRNNRNRGNNNRGMFGAGANRGGPPADDQDAPVATPVQPEQQDYHASLYRNKTRRQLYQLGAKVVDDAFHDGRPVFVAVTTDQLEPFEDDLNEAGHYTYRTVAAWSDVALPTDRDAAADDPNVWGGGRFNRRRAPGGGMARLLGLSGQQNDWRLVQVLPGAGK